MPPTVLHVPHARAPRADHASALPPASSRVSYRAVRGGPPHTGRRGSVFADPSLSLTGTGAQQPARQVLQAAWRRAAGSRGRRWRRRPVHCGRRRGRSGSSSSSSEERVAVAGGRPRRAQWPAARRQGAPGWRAPRRQRRALVGMRMGHVGGVRCRACRASAHVGVGLEACRVSLYSSAAFVICVRLRVSTLS